MKNNPAVIERAGVPDNYDPTKGLKTIAVSEAAEIHFSRAKDSTHLYEAVEVKLGEQRRFVLWWDEQAKTPGPGRGKKGLRTDNLFLSLDDLGVDKFTVHRWRTRLKDSRKYELALAAAQERCRRICEAEKGGTEQKGATGTGENEWYTPDKYLEAAREVMGGIDLDPASSDHAQEKVKATRHYTKEIDGLAQDWEGRVWLNPPYAQPFIADFVSKMVSERKSGRVLSAIMLTHNYTDTAWFHEAAVVADAICFTRGRVKFYNQAGDEAAPTQGQAFFYFGGDAVGFAARFREIGFVLIPCHGEV